MWAILLLFFVEGSFSFDWPDGKVREEPAVLLAITDPGERNKEHPIWSKIKEWTGIEEEKGGEEEEIGKDLNFLEGDRMCVTAMLNPKGLGLMDKTRIDDFPRLPLHLYIYDLRLCSTNSDLSRDTSSMLRSYDPKSHFSTGCFTSNVRSLKQHVVISHKNDLAEDKHLIRLSTSAEALVTKRDEVSLSSENVAATACFNVHAVGPSDVPVLVQASVVISLDTNVTIEDKYKNYIEALGISKDGEVEEEEHHDMLHQCLTREDKEEKEEESKWTSQEKNHRLRHRHRKERFKEEKKEKEEVEEGECTQQFNQHVPGSKVVTVTNEKRSDFDYESMQTSKHYYPYYYGHPYYYEHVHIGCRWSLHFDSGAGICETPFKIRYKGTHVIVILWTIVGTFFGLLCYYYDWKARAIFKHQHVY